MFPPRRRGIERRTRTTAFARFGDGRRPTHGTAGSGRPTDQWARSFDFDGEDDYVDHMELIEALALSTINFLSLEADIGPDEMSLPTPCEDWNVSDLLWHVARASEMAVALLNGASQSEASQLFDAEVPSDLIEECHRALNAQLLAMEKATDLDQIVHHPIGDIPVRQLIDFRITDLTLHAWDLARALGVDEDLPDQLVEHVYGVLQPMETFIGETGVFGAGPSAELGPDASAQDRLLDLAGRRP